MWLLESRWSTIPDGRNPHHPPVAMRLSCWFRDGRRQWPCHSSLRCTARPPGPSPGTSPMSPISCGVSTSVGSHLPALVTKAGDIWGVEGSALERDATNCRRIMIGTPHICQICRADLFHRGIVSMDLFSTTHPCNPDSGLFCFAPSSPLGEDPAVDAMATMLIAKDDTTGKPSFRPIRSLFGTYR